jgi:hypothetical protein
MGEYGGGIDQKLGTPKRELPFVSFGHNSTRKQSISKGDIPFERLRSPTKSGFSNFIII